MGSHFLISYSECLIQPPGPRVICRVPALKHFGTHVLQLRLLQAPKHKHAVSCLQLVSSPPSRFRPAELLIPQISPYTSLSQRNLTWLIYASNHLNTQTVTTKLVQVTAKSRVTFWLDPGLKKCHQDLIIFLSLGRVSLVLVPKRSSSFMLRWLQWLQLPSSPSNLGGRVDILLQGDSNKCPRI